MKYSSSKGVDRLVHAHVRRDWVVRHGGKHGRLLPPGGDHFVTIPGTSSDCRTLANLQRDIARIERSLNVKRAAA